MGMDVYGNAPRSEAGAYFRNSVWGWHPLADFLLDTYPDLTATCEYWHSNDGDGLDDVRARALGEAIAADLASGKVAEYQKRYEVEQAALPDKECHLCQGTGVRTDEVGVKYGYNKPRDEATGTGGCNGCQGIGRVEAWEKNYPFDLENVTAFAQFLRECGGFAIC